MTSEESFAALASVEAEMNPYEFTKEEWRYFTEAQKAERYVLQRKWREEHEDRWLQAIHNLVPRVGLPCTIIYWSDRRAATVTRIISPNKIAVQTNKTKCLDYLGGNYEILPDLEDGEEIFTKRRNGKWVMEGHKSKDGLKLMLHYQHHYIDPSY